jgi:hypothetical protein
MMLELYKESKPAHHPPSATEKLQYRYEGGIPDAGVVGLSMTSALAYKASQRLREGRWQRGEGYFIVIVHGVHVSF